MIDKICKFWYTCMKYMSLFYIGGIIYYCIEKLYRGYSHPTMLIVGGLAFLFCGLINKVLSWDTPFLTQCILASIGITLIEFFSGCIINLWLGLDVWNYSNLPFNILGQISLLFSFFWIILGGVAIVLDDYLRYWLFKEEKPHYKFF